MARRLRAAAALAAAVKASGRHLTIETAATIEPAGIACDLASLSPKLLNSAPDASEQRITAMGRTVSSIALLTGLALTGCAVAPPTGPSAMALPGKDKSFAAFQEDDASCRGYAQAQLGGTTPAEAATQSAAQAALAGALANSTASGLRMAVSSSSAHSGSTSVR